MPPSWGGGAAFAGFPVTQISQVRRGDAARPADADVIIVGAGPAAWQPRLNSRMRVARCLFWTCSLPRAGRSIERWKQTSPTNLSPTIFWPRLDRHTRPAWRWSGGFAPIAAGCGDGPLMRAARLHGRRHSMSAGIVSGIAEGGGARPTAIRAVAGRAYRPPHSPHDQRQSAGGRRPFLPGSPASKDSRFLSLLSIRTMCV